MKMINKIRNSKTAIISLVVVCMLIIGVSVAYLSDSTHILTNIFTVENIKTNIDEETKGDLTKAPKVENTGDSDALVRIRLSISNINIFKENFGLEGIDNSKTDDWYRLSNDTDEDKRYDTFYYYTKILKSEDDSSTDYDDTKTSPLFTKILKYSNSQYTQFQFKELEDDEGNITYTPVNAEDVEVLKLLTDIEITIYQESIPTNATIEDKDGNQEYVNAVNANGTLNKDAAAKLWDYFDNKYQNQ